MDGQKGLGNTVRCIICSRTVEMFPVDECMAIRQFAIHGNHYLWSFGGPGVCDSPARALDTSCYVSPFYRGQTLRSLVAITV